MTEVLNGTDLDFIGGNLCEERKKSFILVDLSLNPLQKLTFNPLSSIVYSTN
jgi:hypothetical protein